MHGFPHTLRHDALYVDAVLGVGDGSNTAPDSDPQLLVSWSNDGVTFGAERSLSLGTQGARTGRIKTTRLGSSRSRTYRFRASAAAVRTIMAASVDVTDMGA